MKRSLLVILSLVILVISSTSCSSLKSHITAPTTQELAEHEGNATVALVYTITDNDDDEVSDVKPYCSAVWVSDKDILTAHHCVKMVQEKLQAKQNAKEALGTQCSQLAVLFGMCDPNAEIKHKVIELQDLPIHFIQWKETMGLGAEPSAQHLSKLVGWDESRDLALVEAVGEAVPKHEIAVLADKSPEMMAPITVVGHPKGLYWTFLTGTVAGNRNRIPHVRTYSDDGDRVGPFLQVEAPVWFGNSGGGAFNSDGELVGIASFLMRVPDEGFFEGVDGIRVFLTDQKLLK